MRHQFHPLALEEYIAAAKHYAAIQPGLEFQFVACVEEAIDRICQAPMLWRVLEEDVRACLTHVFPYAVLYTIEADYVLIIAVTHCRRQPGFWRARLP